MDEILKPIKTTKKVQSNIEKFESLTLKDSNTQLKQNNGFRPDPHQPAKPLVELVSKSHGQPLTEISKSRSNQPMSTVHSDPSEHIRTKQHKHHKSTIFVDQSYLNDESTQSLPDNAREILRNQPSHEDLVAVLQYLQFGVDGRHEFDIRRTSPQAAQLINVLVTITVPDIWPSLVQNVLSEDEAQLREILLSCLSSVAGIGALLIQIKQKSLTYQAGSQLHAALSVLKDILKGKKTVTRFLHDAQFLYTNESARKLFWHEVTALLAGSRVLSTVALAISHSQALEDLKPYLWLGSGSEYTSWLAKNVATAAVAQKPDNEEGCKFLSQLVIRGMGLGYRDAFVSEMYTMLLLGTRALWTPLQLILQCLTPREQKTFFDSVLSDLARKYLAPTGEFALTDLQDQKLQKSVAGVAALVVGLIKHNEVLEEHLVAWLTGDVGASKNLSLSLKRALVAALGQSQEKLQRVLEKALSSFGDKLAIQHVPLLQQEATAQTILLVVGYLSRIDISNLKDHHVSTLVMHSVSNRLASSLSQTRLLGMIVGTAVSKLVDKQENILNFDLGEMEEDTIKMWLNLTSIHDEVGDIEQIGSLNPSNFQKQSDSTTFNPSGIRAGTNRLAQQTKIIAIKELTESSESEEEGLVPYQKLDSDSEDSEEDPTLINRSKPSAPVYIVDLIKQLQLTDKRDIVAMALKTGPNLIRRKTGFGTELSDNVQMLATTLINFQDGTSEPELEQLRLDSLIACVVACPQAIGPSLADTYFRGDFSLSQRTMLLVAIGLAVRELAGFKEQTSTSTNDKFPSKRLPAHLEPQPLQQITSTSNPIAMLTNNVAHDTIRPMALAAADQATGPAALKVRTFSSRMEVEKKNEKKAIARTKRVPKNLHKLLAEAIYLPLCSRMSLLLSHSTGHSLPNTTLMHTSTLKLFLQTLTLVLHTLGPSAIPYLPILSRETLLLLTSLHNIVHTTQDPAVLPALLHLLLALLDIVIEAGITAQELLITDFGAQVAELVTWSNGISDTISVPDAGGAENGVSWTILVAGIQVKWFEMGKRFQGRMLGLTMDEMDQLSGA